VDRGIVEAQETQEGISDVENENGFAARCDRKIYAKDQALNNFPRCEPLAGCRRMPDRRNRVELESDLFHSASGIPDEVDIGKTHVVIQRAVLETHNAPPRGSCVSLSRGSAVFITQQDSSPTTLHRKQESVTSKGTSPPRKIA